jgi:hypothetical protein
LCRASPGSAKRSAPSHAFVLATPRVSCSHVPSRNSGRRDAQARNRRPRADNTGCGGRANSGTCSCREAPLELCRCVPLCSELNRRV